MTLDVFTDQRFGGNPLAVVFDADGLDTKTMQIVAREFNYSETTFVCQPQSQKNTAQVRIFTPQYEMPFAGHPNIGTAVALAIQGRLTATKAGDLLARFEEQAGLVALTVGLTAGGGSARLTSPQAFSIQDKCEPDLIAGMVELALDDIVTKRHPPLIASCGNPFLVAEVASPEALAALPARLKRTTGQKGLPNGLSLYARLPGEGRIKTRMFSSGLASVEDPATGSAAVVLAGVLASQERAKQGRFDYQIHQGDEMGRPSMLYASADKQSGKVKQTHVGGGAVTVFEGWLTI